MSIILSSKVRLVYSNNIFYVLFPMFIQLFLLLVVVLDNLKCSEHDENISHSYRGLGSSMLNL